MSMSILVGIDGTGSEPIYSLGRDERYDAIYFNSFVRRLCQKASAPNAIYFRGPDLSGAGLMNACFQGIDFILTKQRAGIKQPILLTGHSRGGTGVIYIAHRLSILNIPVKAMLLFDSVDKQTEVVIPAVIPTNVEHVLHLIRDEMAGSRTTFGNSGTKAKAPTKYTPRSCFCTHSAVGGVPWPVPEGKSEKDYVMEGWSRTNVTYAQDKDRSKGVWRYAKPFMLEHGFPHAPDSDLLQ